ncbi:hypothetical protein ICW40_19895 [Actinotalea ferrariae]|uniref:hypothetical protein n=1 Tax=Actinotalea ferrariae TaxID=1386098 RepID=UPI001C8B9E71|nr:hypothetical protein [Actinotalea ferrariae]MBX9247057.1 hypothetical protein [Actinotalea ferrariae]
MTGWPVAPVPATWVASTQTPGPAEPELQEGVDPDSVTPGVLGFVVTLFAVLACIPLFLSMTKKIRGVQHRGRLEAEAEAEAAAGAEASPRAEADAAQAAGAARADDGDVVDGREASSTTTEPPADPDAPRGGARP